AAKTKRGGVTAPLPPARGRLVGAIGLEPTTPTMSRWCSNQLSYAPERKKLYTIRGRFPQRRNGQRGQRFVSREATRDRKTTGARPTATISSDGSAAAARR